MTAPRIRRTPIPSHEHCVSTIEREAHYWARKFQGHLTYEDLRQEASIIAIRALRTFDPSRGPSINTYLTAAIRNRFRRLVKRTFLRAFTYHPGQYDAFRNAVRNEPVHPEEGYIASILLARLRALPAAQQKLAWDLVNTQQQSILGLAKQRRITAHRARTDVLALRRAVLRRPFTTKGMNNA